ncbi:hypothetical protein MTO96_024655 [Rhipicephalus appendiculatus]
MGEQWHRMFETYLLASGATEFSPERRRAILIHCLGTEGQRIFNTLPATAATTPTASADKPDATGTPTAPNVYDVAVAALRQHFASTSNVLSLDTKNRVRASDVERVLRSKPIVDAKEYDLVSNSCQSLAIKLLKMLSVPVPKVLTDAHQEFQSFKELAVLSSVMVTLAGSSWATGLI